MKAEAGKERAAKTIGTEARRETAQGLRVRSRLIWFAEPHHGCAERTWIPTVDRQAKPMDTYEMSEQTKFVHDHRGAHRGRLEQHAGHSRMARIGQKRARRAREHLKALKLRVVVRPHVDIHPVRGHRRCVSPQLAHVLRLRTAGQYEPQTRRL